MASGIKKSAIQGELVSLQKELNSKESSWLPGADLKCAEKMKEFLSTVKIASKTEPLDQTELKNVYTYLTDKCDVFSKRPAWFTTIRCFTSRVLNYFSKRGEFKTSWEIGEDARSQLLSKCKPLDLVRAQAQNKLLISKKEIILQNISSCKKGKSDVIRQLQIALEDSSCLLENKTLALLEKENVLPRGFCLEIKETQETALIQHCFKNKLFKELKEFSESKTPISIPGLREGIKKYLPLFEGIERALASERPEQCFRDAFIRFIEDSKQLAREEGTVGENVYLKELFPSGIDNFIVQSLLEDRVSKSIMYEYKAVLDSSSFYGPNAVPFINELFMRLDDAGAAGQLELAMVRAEVLIEKIEDLDRIDDAELLKDSGKPSLSLSLQQSSKKYSSLLIDRAEEEIKKAQSSFLRSSKVHHMNLALRAIDKFFLQSPDSHDGIRLSRQANLFSDYMILDREINTAQPQGHINAFLNAIVDKLPDGVYKNKVLSAIQSQNDIKKT